MCAESKQSQTVDKSLNIRDQREMFLGDSFSNIPENVVYGVIKAGGFGRVPGICNQFTIGGAR